MLRFPRLSISAFPLLLLLVTACTANLDGSFGGGEEGGTTAALPDDGADPTILLVEPSIGAVVPAGEVRFVGRVDDESPVTLATDGGESIPVAADGTFDHPITVTPGAHRVRLVATDGSGRRAETFTAFASGTFADESVVVGDAVLADVSSGVLDQIGDGAGTLLTMTSFDAQLNDANPIADDWWGEVNLQGEDHGQVTIDLVPAAGRITATVQIAGIRVRARASTPIASASGELRADVVRVTATIALRAEGGRLVGAVDSSSVDLTGTVLDVNNFPDIIENLDAIRSAIEREARSALDDAVRDMLPPLIADGLASIPSGETVEILETPLTMTVGVSALDIDPAGIGTVLDLGVRAAVPLGTRGGVGYLTLPRTAAPPTGDELSIAIAFDALNAAFAALWAGGGMDQRIDGLEFGGGPLTAGTLGLLLPFAAADAPPDAPLAIDISPRLAPVIVPTASGGLEVQAADIRITFVALAESGEVEMATISLGAFADAAPRAEAGRLAIDLGMLRISADVVDGPATAPTGEELSELLSELVTTLAPDLLGGAAVAVPSLYGFDLIPSRVSTAGGYLTLEGAIAYGP